MWDLREVKILFSWVWVELNSTHVMCRHPFPHPFFSHFTYYYEHCPRPLFCSVPIYAWKEEVGKGKGDK